MSFLNALPLPILVSLGFAVLGFCNYWRQLDTWRAKIKMFDNYRKVLVDFHNNFGKNNHIETELRDYLLENALRINSDSIIHIKIDDPVLGISTGIMNVINDIVTHRCYDFTRACQDFKNGLTQNIGAFKDKYQETRSKIISPISLVKNGIFLILDTIPIVKLIPTKIKGFLFTLFMVISVAETFLSLLSQKSLLLSIIRQIRAWIS